ncbi:JDVT-CTERM system glutamic-type intramembrane protease [Vibrio breoganii]|uniref:JDVT-CTERM system glutamic-type intramembrane protease MrtJ n=1 Tax=Vibrio breoganii TaxID=553239 RepID=UPI000C81F630|nr:JDVT-CTERM system glutamic-type intramembrane protease [Vibrio breoganii]
MSAFLHRKGAYDLMHNQQSQLIGLLDEFALRGDRKWVSERMFKVACLFGFAIGLLLLSSPAPISQTQQAWQTLLMVVVVSPLLEELLFRGVMQGRLLRLDWGSRHLFGFTLANLCSSLLFTALHFISHQPLWALSVLFPSLLFGYFRDRHNSVYPSIALHIFYNAVYFILPIVISIHV